MEELVILKYSSFATLGKRAKYDAQLTGHSKRVTDQALCGQLYFDELRRDHLGWSTACSQELGLFLLECLLHNTAAMWQKEKGEDHPKTPVNQPK